MKVLACRPPSMPVSSATLSSWPGYPPSMPLVPVAGSANTSNLPDLPGALQSSILRYLRHSRTLRIQTGPVSCPTDPTRKCRNPTKTNGPPSSSDPPDRIRKKIASVVTDSGSEIKAIPENPAYQPTHHSFCFSGQSIPDSKTISPAKDMASSNPNSPNSSPNPSPPSVAATKNSFRTRPTSNPSLLREPLPLRSEPTKSCPKYTEKLASPNANALNFLPVSAFFAWFFRLNSP